MIKKFTASFALAGLLIGASSYAATSSKYIGLEVGSQSYDDISYNEDALFNLSARTLYTGEEFPFVFGIESDLAGNSDTFLVDLGLNLGGNIAINSGIDAIKLYTILGYGIQTLDFDDDYTYLGQGVYYGIGATFDYNKDFAINLNYKIHNNTINSDNNSADGYEYDMSHLMLGVAIKFDSK